MQFEALVARITALPPAPTRRVIAVAGPPASGKSTLAARLAAAIDGAVALPMDGFHLDDRLLIADGTRDRKGAPHTFDAAGFVRLIAALQEPADLIFPIFDRSREMAIAGAGRVPATCDTVVVEGNYLMLNDAPWDALRPHWSLSIALTPPRDVLHDRLVARWQQHGKPDAAAWIAGNDMPNVDTVLTRSAPADITLTEALP
ncbi:MAG: nucleoside/nucleotide kinase family protein [Pseudomonadota bacterium]